MGPRVALVHRPRRDDWSLPKGKLSDGEGWEEAALREVEEETGCRPRITSFAGVTSVVERRPPKVVLYWNMVLVREGKLHGKDEVDEVRWTTLPEALALLDSDSDRRLLRRAPSGGIARRARGSAAIEGTRADLLRRDLAPSAASDGAFLGPALELLDEADDLVAAGDPGELRVLLLAARWLTIRSVEEPERSRLAEALRDEGRRIAQRRRRMLRRLRTAPGNPLDSTAAQGDELARRLELDAGGARGALALPVVPETVGPLPRGGGMEMAGVDEEEGRRARGAVRRAGVFAVGTVSVLVVLGLGLAIVLPSLRAPLFVGGLAGLVGGAIVALAAVAAGLRRRRG